MKITVPDDIETFTEDESVTDSSEKEAKKTFKDEIKDILWMAQVPQKFIVDDVDKNTPELKLQVLLKFTQLCREEIIPRHIKAADAIEAKSDELRCELLCQQKEIKHLLSARKELQESMEKLEKARTLAAVKHQDLNLRLEDALQKIQDKCKNKTLAERKFAQDLVDLKKKAENLKVGMTDASSKMNYYNKQVKAQTDIVKKHTKPLYLDKNRVVFLKESLNVMRVSIEELVSHVKKLKMQTSSISGTEETY